MEIDSSRTLFLFLYLTGDSMLKNLLKESMQKKVANTVRPGLEDLLYHLALVYN